MNLRDYWPLDSTDTANIIAGALGGAVRAVALKLPFRDLAIAIFVGSVCAKYLYPIGNAIIDPIVSKITSTAGQTSGLGGFIIGVIGIAVVGFLMELFRSRFPSPQKEA